MLLKIFILLILLIVVPPFFLDRTIIRHRFKSKKRFLFYLPNIAMLVSAILLTAFETYTPNNAIITNWFLTLFLGYIVTEAILALFLGIGYQFRKHIGWRNTLYALGIVSAIGNLYIIIIGVTQGKERIITKHISINSSVLPQSFDGYRIVQISDLHLGTYHKHPQFVERLVSQAMQQKPDLIVFTGDLVNYNADEIDEFTATLSKLKAKDGVYSIMGNHDYMTYIKWKDEESQLANIRKLQIAERKAGWHLLLNDHRLINRNGENIALIGIENDGKPPFPQRADMAKATLGLPAKLDGKPVYKILLSHDPSLWDTNIVGKTNIQLTLSGHTHGGQLKVWGFAPISLFTKRWSGLYQEKAQKLYISTGLGEALLTFRYGFWPQIEVITLQRKAS